MSINKILSLALLLASAPVHAEKTVTRARYLMGTVCEITARGPAAEESVTAAFHEIERWDGVLSSFKNQSEASRMNQEAGRAPFACSESLWEAVTAALDAAKKSQGAFDPTLKPNGYSHVRLDAARRTVKFQSSGLKLDFGGIGKGLALDHAAAVMRAQGVTSALLNFGGQVYALGSWTVQSPAGPLEVKDASVSTSGDSEQPGHILDPRTGRSVHNPDATVVAPTGAEADAWSTALYVTGGDLPPAFRACRSCRYYKGGRL